MQTKISSISLLDEVTTLSTGDLFVVSEPNEYAPDGEYTLTGYVSKKLSFGKFSDYLSVLVYQNLLNKISNISGEVNITQMAINNISGTLILNITNQIENVSGDVNVAISAVNVVAGDVYQNLSTLIQNVSGNVSSVNQLETNVNAIEAHITNNVDTSINLITGDVYAPTGILNQLSAVRAYVYNEILTAVEAVVGDLYIGDGIWNRVDALCSEINNKINIELNNITGDVYISGGIYNWVSALTANINSIINDVSALSAAMHYPIRELNDAIADNGQTDYVLIDKSVNVITLNDDQPCYITFEKINLHNDSVYYSRDFELIVYCNVVPNIKWDTTVQYMSPDGDDILSAFDVALTYVYYISEIGKDIMYISRQEVENITPILTTT